MEASASESGSDKEKVNERYLHLVYENSKLIGQLACQRDPNQQLEIYVAMLQNLSCIRFEALHALRQLGGKEQRRKVREIERKKKNGASASGSGKDHDEKEKGKESEWKLSEDECMKLCERMKNLNMEKERLSKRLLETRDDPTQMSQNIESILDIQCSQFECVEGIRKRIDSAPVKGRVDARKMQEDEKRNAKDEKRNAEDDMEEDAGPSKKSKFW
ncbi:hypothetical protein VNO78_30643 [Psophocarpus tetragonolobus]|uniref:Uncharacterized protein n=1 Tax=Psophocarpus tetragonolobus TaxID=3891 RepID=A0AAN9RWZ8_PSOTE